MSRVAPRVDVPGDGPRVLSSIRLADVLGSSPHGVVRLAHTQTIADALRTLSQYNILSAPVVVHTNGGAGSPSSGISSEEDATQTETLIGWVRHEIAPCCSSSHVLLQADVQEILHDFIVPNTPRLAQVATWDAAMEATAAAFCARRLLVVTGEDGALLPQVSADMTLMEAVTSGFLSVGGDPHTLTPRSRGAEADEGDAYEHGVAPAPGRAVHRLALFADGKIRSIVSQSDVMRYLYATSERLGPLARETVDALGFVAAAKKVLCVTPATPAFAAFNVMYGNALSAVGIVDPETEALVGTLSASDVRRLQAHTFNTLVLPVRDFLLAQAPAAQQDLRPPLAVSPAAPFLRVLELLGGSPRIHRVYVTDVRGRPVGVITPTDVLRFLVARES